jgi:hypothetical protein
MSLINAHLSVEALGGDLVTLLITDAYGHINGRIDLNPSETSTMIDHLQRLLPVDVEAVAVEEAPGVEWGTLTRAQIIDKAHELFDVRLDADDTKAKLVEQAKDLEAQVA